MGRVLSAESTALASRSPVPLASLVAFVRLLRACIYTVNAIALRCVALRTLLHIDTPAAASALKPEDVILKIGHTNVEDLCQEDMVTLFQSMSGSKLIKLTVQPASTRPVTRQAQQRFPVHSLQLYAPNGAFGFRIMSAFHCQRIVIGSVKSGTLHSMRAYGVRMRT